MSQLTVFQAIDQMQKLSEDEVPFSFSFISDTKQTSKGVVTVRKGRLKLKDKRDKYENADIMLEYLDLDTMEHRRFYLAALMTFNGQRLILT